MKQRPSLLTIIQNKRKAVYAFFAVTIFLLLVIAIPVALKTRSSRQSGSAQMSENGAILGTSNQTSIQSNAVEPIPSLNPTMYRFWDDDTVSNSGDSIHYLRQSSASPSDVHQRENRTLAPRGISFSPSYVPSDMPTASPSSQPSASPSTAPSGLPTVQSNELSGVNISFIPGLLTHIEFGLLLSSGLTARPLAVSGQRVEYTDGSRSSIPFHSLPDAGATFSRSDGGWVYVNNAEVDTENGGGVGALTFDGQGNIIDYKMVLENTRRNCGGGRTPWDTWISCEETSGGVNYQVDPMGIRPPAPITLGQDGGYFESFAYRLFDDLARAPEFFVTEDAERGALQRFIPSSFSWDDPWTMLHGPGSIHYLLLHPTSLDQRSGTFSWTTDRSAGRQNAKNYYPFSEGIDVYDSMLFFVCKKIRKLFSLDLNSMTYTRVSTVSGLFDGGPDQLKRILADGGSHLLFFTEEGGVDAGIHGRDETGMFFTLLESPVYIDETTGLAFSPDARRMYVAYQENGLLFEVTRKDGLPFHAKSLNVKYHNA